ncbi:hypothetical protein GOBAR_AA28086 [Gossypium barbadense]|uniref:RNase H type-1 domain-containing protein n=1 Tax=Gossypium barbadense TaxID=3634 RepID=A0A2P5WNC5_GOSBA|nr:hypothetical protein GOBAR_AA28086 [Gossypium barbadense]
MVCWSWAPGMKVGSGSTVSVRDDVWLPGEGPYKVQSPRVSDINVVADLINKEGCWNEELIRTFFTAVEAGRILCIPILKFPFTVHIRQHQQLSNMNEGWVPTLEPFVKLVQVMSAYIWETKQIAKGFDGFKSSAYQKTRQQSGTFASEGRI